MIGHKLRARGIVNFCQQAGAYLLKEVRGSQIGYFLEPGSIRVRREYAEEAVRSGWLTIRDRDLFGQPMSWIYAPKPPRFNMRVAPRPSQREPITMPVIGSIPSQILPGVKNATARNEKSVAHSPASSANDCHNTISRDCRYHLLMRLYHRSAKKGSVPGDPRLGTGGR
jgi:hypothetical protein